MTDDKLFVKSLNNVKKQLVEERADITRTDKLNSEIAAEYDAAIEIFERSLPKIHEIDDVWDLPEEDYVFMIESLETYSENFIIDGRNPEQLKKDEAEFSQLQDILFEFYDDGEDEEDTDSDEADDEGMEETSR